MRFPSRPWGQRKNEQTVVPGDSSLWAGYNLIPVDNTIIDLGSLGADLPGTAGPVVLETPIGVANKIPAVGGWNSGAAAFPSETLTTITIEYWWRPRTGVANNSVFLEIGANVVELRSQNAGSGLQVVVEGASAFNQDLGVTPETWHHIMITYTNGVGGNVYVDGVIHATAVTNQGNLSGITRLSIGTDSSGTLTSEGDLLSPCIYDTIKSATFAAEKYKSGAKAAQYTSLWGVIESISAEGGIANQYLSNTGFQFADATTRWLVGANTDTDGRAVKYVYPSVGGYIYKTADSLKLSQQEMLYGTWDFSIYKTGDAAEINFVMGSDDVGALFNGYYVQFDSSERLRLYERTGAAASTVLGTAAGALSLLVVYDVRVTRSYAGEWRLYYKTQGTTTWTEVGSGATDTTHTSAEYLQLGASAYNVVYWSTFEGNVSITKRLGVVAP